METVIHWTERDGPEANTKRAAENEGTLLMQNLHTCTREYDENPEWDGDKGFGAGYADVLARTLWLTLASAQERTSQNRSHPNVVDGLFFVGRSLQDIAAAIRETKGD